METTDISRPNILMRPAVGADLPYLDEVRQAAFEPIFDSFRSILGQEIYDLSLIHI